MSNKKLDQILTFICRHYMETICMATLAREGNLSRFAMCRQFTKKFGMPPSKWLVLFRLHIAFRILQLNSPQSTQDIAFDVGFGSASHFCRTFKKIFGVSPKMFRGTGSLRRIPNLPQETMLLIEKALSTLEQNNLNL